MKALAACLGALALALALAVIGPAHLAHADPAAVVVPQHVLPAAPSKTTKPTPKPKPSATPTPAPSASVTSRRQSAAEAEGERWVQIAMVAGGALLGSMALFFGLGTLLRRRPRPKA